MAATSGWTLERARRHLDGYASDELSWHEFGEAVIGVLAAILPHDAVCVASVDPDSGLFTSLVFGGFEPTAQLDLFMEIELTQPDPITLTTLARQPAGVGILADHVAGDPRSNPRCRELLGPHFGLEHELRGVVRPGGRMWAAAALYREPARRGFTTGDAAALSAVEDVVGRGVQRCLVAASGGEPGGRAADPAVVILDADGRLDEITAAAETYLVGITGHLRDELPTAIRTTAAAARTANDCRRGRPAFARLPLATGEWVVVRAALLAAGEGAAGRVAVTIEPAGVSTTLGIMIDAHGLTDREADVVRGVVAGASTAELATTLRISRYTVQDHLKAVFRKAGVSSRRQLVARFCRTAPLGDGPGSERPPASSPPIPAP